MTCSCRRDYLSAKADYEEALLSVNQSQAQIVTARATLAQHQESIAQATVRAPIGGTTKPTVQPTAELYEATAEQLKSDRDTALLSLRQQLDQAFSDVKGTEERIQFATREVEVAQKNFQIAYKRYATGLSDITERSFLYTAQNDYVNAIHDKKIAEGRLRATPSYQPEPMIDLKKLLHEE